MKLEGRVWKDGKWWLVGVSLLDVMTQGHTKAGALEMIADAVESLVNVEGFKVTVSGAKGENFYIGANRPAQLVALLLRRQRAAHQLSLADVTERLGQSSRGSYARYEAGKREPSIEKLGELLGAIDPSLDFVIQSTAPKGRLFKR
jgi:hypothetical protein